MPAAFLMCERTRDEQREKEIWEQKWVDVRARKEVIPQKKMKMCVKNVSGASKSMPQQAWSQRGQTAGVKTFPPIAT